MGVTSLHELARDGDDWNRFVLELHRDPSMGFEVIESQEDVHQLFLKKSSPSKNNRYQQIYNTTDVAPIHILAITLPQDQLPLLRFYLEKCPSAASLLTSENRSPLHYACLHHAPLPIVLALLEAHPEIITRQDYQGQNPLHICASTITKKHPYLIKSIIDKLQQHDQRYHLLKTALAQVNPNGRSPFILACDLNPHLSKRDFSLLQHHSNPTDETKLCALERVAGSYQWHFQSALQVKAIPRKVISNKRPSRALPRKISLSSMWLWRPQQALDLQEGLWKVLTLLGGTNNSFQRDAGLPILHRALTIGAPTLVVNVLLSLNPYYACQLDEHAALPIHILCRRMANYEDYKLAHTILTLYPRGSAIKDQEGRIPLYALAKQNQNDVRWEWVKLLVECHAVGLAHIGLEEGLYPQLLTKVQQPTHVYRIFRESPSLFASFLR